jgi:PEP-CTERM motif
MTTKFSLFVCALVLLVAPVTEAATQQLYTAVVDAGVDLDADLFNGFTFSSSTTPSAAPGFPFGFDFDDTNPSIHPGAADNVDGLDNDQDGVIDGSVGATSINALPDIVLAEGQSFSADWIITGINASLIGVFLQAGAAGATYSDSVTDTLEVTATVGWTAQVGDVGQTYLFRINAPDIDEFTVTVVPEPSSLLLGLFGCAALAMCGWQRIRRNLARKFA